MRYPVSDPCFGPDETAAVAEVMASGRVSMGERVAEFEERFAAGMNCGSAVAVSSGTAALHVAIVALGIGPGDEVLVPDLTFVATANAVRYAGATPVFVDVECDGWCLDPRDAEHKATSKTKAIIPVHLYGNPARMWDVLEFAKPRGLYVLEDAAEAIGGSLDGRPLGTFGHCGVFSFYGNKTLSTGEGGMLVTDDPGLAAKFRLLRGQGQGPERYRHIALGFNYRLTDLQAAVGLVQLRKLDENLAKRREVVEEYMEALDGVATFQFAPDGGRQAPWLATCVLPPGVGRDLVASRLAAEGIETRPAFVPMHDQPFALAESVFPESTRIGARGLSLPTHPGMTRADAKVVSFALLDAIRAEREAAK